ncbi:GTP 3',8-cyclase MoaA [Kosmotoga sp.]|uniref:GTP 3',8-cyclase MoaA n=1 Tax=Kosmotoga sp. TaxID=1955248 RepID=UPI0024AC28BE|nr:GTP 3',8-cyclase MoaA [Kosmotoga sp.]MDI3524530.1 3,8-cyclase [Kosmotoga sp.]MDK2953959.1 3,8-cyclase [Kosmotoga sp.]
MKEELKDKFGRNIDYLRFSITDRCNFRCFYCMPENTSFLPESELLTLDDIRFAVQIFKEIGFKRLRLTGGEPTLRSDLLEIVSIVSETFGSCAMTTNGSRLKELAFELYSAGLREVNVSLDSIDSETFFRITRGGNLKEVLKGIDEAISVGMKVKLNTVITQMNFHEIPELVQYAEKLGVPIRFIEEMPIGKNNNRHFIPHKKVLELLHENDFIQIETRIGYGPARYYKTSRGTIVGFITAITHNFCNGCNKLRLSADGKLFPCLAYDYHVSLKGAIKSRRSDEVKKNIYNAISLKPLRHELLNRTQSNGMNRMGG